MPSQSGSEGLFAGILQGFAGGLHERRQQQFEVQQEERASKEREKTEFLRMLDKQWDDPDTDRNMLLKQYAGVFSDHLRTLMGIDPTAKGSKGKGKGGLIASLADPESMGALLTNLHQGFGGGQNTAQRTVHRTSEGVDQSALPEPSSGSQRYPTPEERRQRDLKDYAAKKKIDTDEAVRAAQEEGRYNKVIADKDVTPDPSQPTGWARIYRDNQGNEIRREAVGEPASARPKVDNSPEGRRAQMLVDAAGKNSDGTPKLTMERAREIGSRQILAETKQRLDQSAAMSLARLKLDTERYAEMVEQRPYTLAAKELGIELSTVRLDQAGQTDPVKVLTVATKTAQAMVAKRGLFAKTMTAMGLNPQDDETTIRNGLISEMTGGVDPVEIEAAAKSKGFQGTPKEPPKPSTGTNPFR